MKEYLISGHQSYPLGYTSITKIGESKHDTGMNFGILKLEPGELRDLTNPLETAYLLMQGQLTFDDGDKEYLAQRNSLFDQDPIAAHVASEQPIKIKAHSACELIVVQTENSVTFPTMIFDANNMLESEKRGKGLLDDTAYRIVRTIFDARNRKQAKLVLGEVVNFPGCWSSYPPHHHPQPEIYHYRFTESLGYGHAECGDEVYKIQQYDTLKILNLNDHAQVAAPGYGMYYVWAIRHLEEKLYDVPEFTKEHDWTRHSEANQRVWRPKVG